MKNLTRNNRLFFFLSLFALTGITIIILFELISWVALTMAGEKQKKSYSEHYQEQLQAKRVWDDLRHFQPDPVKHPQEGKMPHPYLGFTEYEFSNRYYGINLDQGPQGQKNKKQFVVAILGGSVATHLCRYFDEHPDLRHEVEIYLGKSKEKEGRWVCGAMGSAKQPQSFSVLAHYGHLLDVTLNIDGFNEVTQDSYPDHPLEFPAFSPILFPRGRNYSYAMLALGQKIFHAQVMEKLSTFFLRFPLSYSSTVFLLWKAVDRLLLEVLQPKKLELPLTYLGPEDHPYQKEMGVQERAQVLAQIWQRFTLRQWWLARDQGLQSFFFLQPNQYAEETIPFKKDKNWIKSDAHLLQQVSAGYPHLRQHLAQLKKVGLPIFDLSGVVRPLGWPAYMDPCCHFHAEATELLAKKIVSVIKDHYENKRTDHLSD